jgi:3-deoxy-manno-octulosonate cytidylyltransferase (CMP-KDO synthetase)
MNDKAIKMLSTDDILGIIPARMASSRFPGKPLALINGIPMVIRVFREASKVLKNLVIASGDEEIEQAAEKFGAGFIRTSGDHQSGTSRCLEAMKSYSDQNGRRFSSILNIQGDEPMVTPEAISTLANDIIRPEILISTLVRAETDQTAFHNPNRVKVALSADGFALYFSRSPIPFYRNPGTGWFSHVGMYAFETAILEKIGSLQPGRLEMAESLEQLRWLEFGYRIHCCETEYNGFGVDTPEDLESLLNSRLL